MGQIWPIFWGLMIPFIGTTLGAATVFLLRKEINPQVQKLLSGFAAGVMIAASVWSLLIPASEMAEEQGLIPWVPTVVGFLIGIVFLLILDIIIPHLHPSHNKPEGVKSKLSKTTMLTLSVTLHNIPEGMAVGVLFAGFISGNSTITLASAFALSFGIAIQNFPEGAIISMPLKAAGETKLKSFTNGMLSGIVEPIAAVITILLTNLVVPILPYVLSFAAGAMIYVVVEELIPESQEGEHTNIGTIGVAVGFSLMMLLDNALG